MRGRIFWPFGGKGEKQLATKTKNGMSHTTTVAQLSYTTTVAQLSHTTTVAQLSPECGTIGSIISGSSSALPNNDGFRS
jgi:hypothetical protein